MSKKLMRLAASVYNRPHLITEMGLVPVLDYIDKRNIRADYDDLIDKEDEDGPEDDDNWEIDVDVDGDTAVIYVDGGLTYKPVYGLCGAVGVSYVALENTFDKLISMGIKTVVMEFSTPGGEASHLFEIASNIRKKCDDAGVQIVGYADEMAASAGYALLSICDITFANPSAVVGSIGCVVALMDISKYLEQQGLKRIFITSGADKVPYADDGSFKESFLQDIQESVDELATEFFEFVSENTDLSVEDIVAMNAKCFSANKAAELGLVDGVMTRQEFSDFLGNVKTMEFQ